MFSVHSRKARKDEDSQSDESTAATEKKGCCDHECKSQSAQPSTQPAAQPDQSTQPSPSAHDDARHHALSTSAQPQPKPVKDIWDKVGAVAPIISGILIFGAGGLFTYAYNEQQLRLQEVQTIEKFIPHLMGSEPSKKAAILAISSLTNPELAARFASIFASSGTVSALQSIAEQGDQHEKKVATKALAIALENLEIRDSKISDLENAYKSLQDKTKEGTNTQPDQLPPVQQLEGLTPARLDKLAQAYKAIGQYANAEPLLKESLAIRERAYGTIHPEVAASAKRLADLYQAMGNQQELADSLYKKAKDIENKVADTKQTPATPASTSDPNSSQDSKKDQQSDQKDSKDSKGDVSSAEKESMLDLETLDNTSM